MKNSTNFFVRHCETPWNREGRFQGKTDIPLNDCGEQQARQMALRLSQVQNRHHPDIQVNSIITSPLSRARQTAELMADTLNLSKSLISHDNRLSELSFGVWEGMTSQEIKDQYYDDRKARKAHRWTFAPPGGESSRSRIPEITEFLDQLPPSSLVVTHSGVIRIILFILAGLPDQRAANLIVPHGSVLVSDGTQVREYGLDGPSAIIS